MSSMPAHDQPSSAAISPRSCPTVVGGRPLCACGAKLYRNRKRCVSCALGWTEFAPESHAERLQRIRADRLARQQAEDAKRIEALRAARAERQERAQLLAKIARIASGARGHRDNYVDAATYIAIAYECDCADDDAKARAGT